MTNPKPQKPKTFTLQDNERDKYAEARRAWNKNARGGMKTLVTFQFLTGALAVVTLMSLNFAFTQIQAPKYIPYLLEKDAEGNFTFKGMLSQGSVPLTDSLARNSLKTFISNIRSVSSDIVVNKLARFNSGYLVTDSGRNKLMTLLNENPVENLVAKQVTVDLQFDYYSKVAEKTWLVHWTEIISHNGAPTQRVPMTGTFSFIQANAQDEKFAENNPWNLYYTDFFISEAKN